MKCYRIQMMDERNYCRYMNGSYDYEVVHYDVKAESKEQALAIAKKDNPSYFLNEGYVEVITEMVFTMNEKDVVIARIAKLEKELALAREELKRFE